MTALAVLAALLAAMFVALQAARAADCVTNPDITLGFGEDCTITLSDIDAAATDASIDIPTTGGATGTTATVTDGVLTIEAAGTAVGTATVTITKPDADTADGETNDGTTARDETATDDVTSFTVNVVGLAITKVAVKGDSDNVVKAGPQVTVTVTVRSAAAGAEVRLTVPTTGLSLHGGGDGTGTGTSQSQTKVVSAAGTTTTEFTVNTAGAPANDYTLTFTADDNTFATDNTPTQVANPTSTLTLTIGEPGTGLASATLSLGDSKPDLAFTDANEAVAETGSDVAKATGDADGKINLVVEVLDSLGGKANSSDINQIIVIAPGGEITSDHNTGAGSADDPEKAGGSSSATLNEQDASDTDAAEVGDVGQKTVITISKTDEKPGTVTVYAIVSGPGGAARTEDVTLTFSGPAASMTVHDATESLLSVNVDGDDANDTVDEDEHDTIKLQVTAEDSAGNSAPPPTSGVSIVITDPDGKRQGSSVIGRTGPAKGTDGKYYITLTGTGTPAKPLTAGNWTLKATSGKLEAEATFAVAGAPNDVAVTASQTSSDTIGDVITITASVTDKDGNTVSDGTTVMFSASQNTGLAAIGTGHSGKATKNGEASVKYAVVGAGHSVVSATAGDATGVVVIDSTAGAPVQEEAAPTEPSLSDFANGGRPGLTSYTGPDTTASALLALLVGRANAIWLSSGDGWVLYASADGSMVPGSMNFTVTSGDVIYISN